MSSKHQQRSSSQQRSQATPNGGQRSNSRRKSSGEGGVSDGCKAPVLLYAGEVEVFESHIPTIKRALAAQTFVFSRRSVSQSYNCSFAPEAFVFRRSSQNQQQESGGFIKGKRPSSAHSLAVQSIQALQTASYLPIFNLFVIHLVDDVTYHPAKSVFTEWVAGFNGDAANPFFAIVVLVSDVVKLNRNSSKPACIDKVRGFYGFSRGFEAKYIFLFSTSSSLTSNFAFEVFVEKLKSSIVSAVDVLLAETEDALRKEWEQREQTDWNIVSYLKSHQLLMDFYSAIQLNQAVHESYLELKAYVEQVILNYQKGSSLPWVKTLLAELTRWPGMTLSSDLLRRDKEELFREKKTFSFLDLQNLIFSSIFFQHLRDANSLEHLFLSVLEFVKFTRVVMRSLIEQSKSGLTDYACECWSFVTALSVLLYCKNEARVNLFDFPDHTMCLWEVCRTALEVLGKAVGLYGSTRQTTSEIQTGLEIMAGVEQSDDCIASLQLRRSLSSKKNFDDKYEELITMAISTCKHKGWKRSASWRTVQLADFLVANGKCDLAVRHYSDCVGVYAEDSWAECEVWVRHRLVHASHMMQQQGWIAFKGKRSASVDPVNILAASLAIEDRKPDEKILDILSSLTSSSEETAICSSFLSKSGLRITSFTPVQMRSSSLTPKSGDDVKEFELSIESLFASELSGVEVKWYYSSFDDFYRLGYIRGSQFRFLRPDKVIEKSQLSSSLKESQPDTENATKGTGGSSYINPIDNRFIKGGESSINIKPGTHIYNMQGSFKAAGIYQFRKLCCKLGTVNVEIYPQSTLEFHVNNIAPKVTVKDVAKPIHSHVKTKVVVVAEPSSLPTKSEYHLDSCSCSTAQVAILSDNVVLDGTDKSVEKDVELEVFTKVLADFHHINFHWIVKPSKISLTSICQIQAKRPLTIIPELLPALKPPIMLLTARNGSLASLELSKFRLQHRANGKAEWEDVRLWGPAPDSSVSVKQQSRCCWSTTQAILPLSHELRLSCQYRTEHYCEKSVSWCSIFTAKSLTTSNRCQFMWMVVHKDFYQLPTSYKSTMDINIKSLKPVDLLREELKQGKSYLFTFKAAIARSKKVGGKFLYWVPSSTQWGVSGSNSRGSIELDKTVNIIVTARKPGDDIALPEVIIRNDKDITTPVDLVDAGEFRRVKVVPKKSSSAGGEGGAAAGARNGMESEGASLLSPNSALLSPRSGSSNSPNSIVLRPSIRAPSPMIPLTSKDNM